MDDVLETPTLIVYTCVQQCPKFVFQIKDCVEKALRQTPADQTNYFMWSLSLCRLKQQIKLVQLIIYITKSSVVNIREKYVK